MFKIGNSKELPAIPDNLSEDGKDFVRQCLQRNPSQRSTAAHLLEHPFVKNAALLERPSLSGDPSEAPPVVTNAVRSLGIGHARNLSCLDSEGVGIHQSRGSKIGAGSSDAHTPRNISCPVSRGSPLLHSRSPQHMSGRMSPSPISSPRTTSGSSTPLTGGSGAIPFHHPKKPATYLHENIGMIQRGQNIFYTNVSTPYTELKSDPFRGMPQASYAFQDISLSDNGVLGNQPVLADRVSQQLSRDRIIMDPSMDRNPSLHVLGRNNGI